MEQNDAEMNQILNICSRTAQVQKSVTELRSKISLSNFQMLQLTHNDQKFIDRVSQLNENGINSIQHGNYEEALLYLGEAEKLLEYAASCGRAIDREVILKILNNEAVVYQKTWDLERSISYIEAIIFNLQTFLNSRESLDVVEGLKEKLKDGQNSSFQQDDLEWYMETQYEKLKSILSKKYQLSLYFLQFSCLNSQNQDHKIGLKNAQEALQSFKQAFELSLMFFQLKISIKISSPPECVKLVQQVTFLPEAKPSNYIQMGKQLQEIQKTFDKKSQTPSSFNHILQKYSSLEKKEAKYKNFSLTSVMELKPRSMGEKMILDQSRNGQGLYYIEEVENIAVLTQNVLEYAVTFFTISVQMKQLNSAEVPSPNFYHSTQQQNLKALQSQLYYLLSLKLSVCLVQQLSQFSRYIYKHYFQIYSSEKTKQGSEAMSKMDSLKEKYKKYLPDDKSKNNSKCSSRNLADSEDEFCDNTISEYSISIKLSLVNNPKDSKENKLEKLFKENTISAPDNVINPAPPRLNIDLSQIQSLEYGGSKTFKQNNEASKNLSPHEIIEEEDEDNKQTKKLNCLNVKKIKTVPNLSDVSSNRSSDSMEKEKSTRSKRSRIEKNPNKSKQKSTSKPNKSKKNSKSNSNTSKQKMDIKRFNSPKHSNRKSFQTNISHQINETEEKKKSNAAGKKIFSDKKMLLNVEKQPQQSKKDKNLLIFKSKKKKFSHVITPQPSARKFSQKEENQRNFQKQNEQRLRETKRISKLRKAKSFQQIISPYENIKPVIYQSRDISDTYHIYHKPKLKEKIKDLAEVKKAKSSENLKFTVKNVKNQKKRSSKIEGLNNQLSHNPDTRPLLEAKSLGVKKKQKSSVSLGKELQYQSAIAWQQNAVRMSSASNLINTANEKQTIRKLKSSKSLQESNFSSGYLLKGLNVNSSQRIKAQSIAMTKSIRNK